MPLYIDVHKKLEGLTAEAVREAHAKDLAIQDKYEVKFEKYWYDENTGMIFCFAEAPSKEAMAAVHREAHGIMADEIYEIKEGT
jgi:hypothetical protein